MCGLRQLFFLCGPGMPKGWAPQRISGKALPIRPAKQTKAHGAQVKK